MSNQSRYALWYGRDEPPVKTLALQAGPFSALLDGIDLRYVRLGGVEVVRRLYVAVRDENWNTIPGVITNLQRDVAADHFAIRFDVTHRQHAVDFSWQGYIEGTPDGTIRYRLDGHAGGAFRYNRIGFCLLHPPAQSAGRPYRGRTPDGPIEGVLPDLIGPQRIENGTILPLFPSVDYLEIDQTGEVQARFTFEGDLFEMEDQRNWTDASFKTYGTPLALPWPKDARAGQQIAQSVTINATARGSSATTQQDDVVTVHLGDALHRTLPPLGLGMASHGEALSAREVSLLRALRLDHLRAELHLADPHYREVLDRVRETAIALGCGLELAVFLGDDAAAELTDLASQLSGVSPVARVLVFRDGEPVTGGQWVRMARERLRAAVPGALFAGGTNAYFTDLNRTRPEIAAMDAVTYSLNPQVHAFDETSLVETVAAQADTVRSARAFCGDLPLIVSPVTLKPRFNPNATGPEPLPGPGELPPAVDSRQMSLFGAAWTLGSVKYLAESGVASLTYYETTGWRGVMETEAGAPPGVPFPSRPGAVFPLYHVLADLGEGKGGELLACHSSDPLRVEALAVRAGESVHVLVANMTAGTQQLRLGPLPDEHIAVRYLDEHSALEAGEAPERFRAASSALEAAVGTVTLTLAPYAVARLDVRR